MKIATRKPPACASCFQQLDGRYVDFEAAYDGPVLPGAAGPLPVDDLIICERCLESAFSLIDPQGMKVTIAELEGIVTELIEGDEAKDRIIQGLRSTTNELVEHPVKTYPGRPKLEGVSPEVRKLITRNRRERTEHAKRTAEGKKKAAKKAAAKEAAEAGTRTAVAA